MLHRVEVAGSIPNGMNADASDGASVHGTARSGPPSGWINSLAGGGGAAAGIGGQSTLSRKSGKDKTQKDDRGRARDRNRAGQMSRAFCDTSFRRTGN